MILQYKLTLSLCGCLCGSGAPRSRMPVIIHASTRDKMGDVNVGTTRYHVFAVLDFFKLITSKQELQELCQRSNMGSFSAHLFSFFCERKDFDKISNVGVFNAMAESKMYPIFRRRNAISKASVSSNSYQSSRAMTPQPSTLYD